MADAEKLQKKARALEQRGRWRESLDLYRESVASVLAGDVDAGLWNRIGDLHMRLNQAGPAVDAYGNAATAYERSGLYDTAIALCRKILRTMPGRAETYRALGRISARQGFVVDARDNFARYVEHMHKVGRDGEINAALDELADVAPENLEIDRLIAELRLLASGPSDQAK